MKVPTSAWKKVVVIAFAAVVGFLIWSFTKREIKPVIAVVLPMAENQFWVDVRRGAEKARVELGNEFDVVIKHSTDLNANNQISTLASFLALKQISAVVVGPASDSEIVPTIAAFNKRGKCVVVIDTELSAKELKTHGGHVDDFIGSDNRDGGMKAAREMFKGLKGRGTNVLVLKGSYVHQSAIDRFEGFSKEAARLGLSIIEGDAEWKRERAQEISQSEFIKGSINGIFASNDDMALGAVQAMRILNVASNKYPVIIGFDATVDALSAISDGSMFATIKQDAQMLGYEGVMSARTRLLTPSTPPKRQMVPVQVVPESQ